MTDAVTQIHPIVRGGVTIHLIALLRDADDPDGYVVDDDGRLVVSRSPATTTSDEDPTDLDGAERIAR